MARKPAFPSLALVKSAAKPHAVPPPSNASQFLMMHRDARLAWSIRAMAAGAATAKLIASGRAFDSPWELLQIQQATMLQVHQMGQAWLEGLATLTRECIEMKPADTLSKVVAQELDIVGQFGQLVSAQAAALVALMESAQIGYGDWVTRKLKA